MCSGKESVAYRGGPRRHVRTQTRARRGRHVGRRRRRLHGTGGGARSSLGPATHVAPDIVPFAVWIAGRATYVDEHV